MSLDENSLSNSLEVSCDTCAFCGVLRLVTACQTSETGVPGVVLTCGQTVSKGETLFREGQPFYAAYAVKRGSFKRYTVSQVSERQILGFCLPGELMGLESIGDARYDDTALALEESVVCELRLEFSELLDRSLLMFQKELIVVLSRQMAQERRMSLPASGNSAEERVASFLVHLSERFVRHGFSGESFRLPILRTDMANYLGIATETVSRTMHKFQEQEILVMDGRNLSLRNLPKLRAIARFDYPKMKEGAL